MNGEREQVIDYIEELLDDTKEIRKEERKYKKYRKNLTNSPQELKGRMEAILPKHLVAQNIGKLNKTVWPQMYEFEFEFQDGADGKILANAPAKISREQITEEAAFLMTSIHRDAFHQGVVGNDAPLGLTIRDNSSTRTLNDEPIPLQSIGLRMRPTVLPVPFLVHPNASLSMELKSLWPTDITVNDVTGKIIVVASGYRVRPGDIANLMKELYL